VSVRDPTGGSTFGRTRLTAREIEVLQLIAEGFSNPEMAAELGISIKLIHLD
jgi:DNA-binding CsgD family transcriptional regulator